MYLTLFRVLAENNQIRRLLRVFCAILLAFVCNAYYAITHEYWVVMAALMVMLTPTGSAFYHGFLLFFLFASVVTVISVLFSPLALVTARLSDIALGATIGILTNIFILPDRIDVAFRTIWVPLLKSYQQYFAGILILLLQNDRKKADEGRLAVEKALQHLPAWVYEEGFDIHMRKGHRYFFMKMSHISDILFALNYLAYHPFHESLLEETKGFFLSCEKKVDEFIGALMAVLELKKSQMGVDDFAEDIFLIEKAFNQEHAPLNLLDVEREAVYFAELIQGLKDLRQAMVNLAEALR